MAGLYLRQPGGPENCPQLSNGRSSYLIPRRICVFQPSICSFCTWRRCFVRYNYINKIVNRTFRITKPVRPINSLECATDCRNNSRAHSWLLPPYFPAAFLRFVRVAYGHANCTQRQHEAWYARLTLPPHGGSGHRSRDYWTRQGSNGVAATLWNLRRGKRQA